MADEVRPLLGQKLSLTYNTATGAYELDVRIDSAVPGATRIVAPLLSIPLVVVFDPATGGYRLAVING